MWSEFKKFAMRGNVVDIAVGIIIGIAFGAIVNSLVADVIMPPIGLILGKVDFSNLFITLKEGTTAGPYISLKAAQDVSAVTINYGKFINTIINFLIVAFAVFMLVRLMNKLTAKDKAPAPSPTTKECPFCISTISIKAVKCPNCTSELKK
jgi:large conductance mechanosensitive channel